MRKNVQVNFIVGYPRSGTTLLAGLLSKINNVIVTPETNYFRGARLSTKSQSIKGKKALKQLMYDARISDLGLDYSKIIVDDNDNIDGIYRKLLQFYGHLHNCDTVIEKSPLHALYIEEIWSVFPTARVVHIIRDGRDVIDSNIKQSWTSNNVYKHAAEWRDLVSNMLLMPNERVLHIRYEDLVQSPESNILMILEFLGINADNVNFNNNPSATVVPEWEREWKSKALNEPDVNNIYKWMKRNNSISQNRAMYIMQDLLERLDYPPQTTRIDFVGMILYLLYYPNIYHAIKYLYHLKRDLKKNIRKHFF